jgi:hypothetical protein
MKKTIKETMKEMKVGGMRMMNMIMVRKKMWCGPVQEAEDTDVARLTRKAAAQAAARAAKRANIGAARVARSLWFSWVSVKDDLWFFVIWRVWLFCQVISKVNWREW